MDGINRLSWPALFALIIIGYVLPAMAVAALVIALADRNDQ